jgi:hypothetical protein
MTSQREQPEPCLVAPYTLARCLRGLGLVMPSLGSCSGLHPDVNLTSGIERLCRELDRNLIMSEHFVRDLDSPVFEIGNFRLQRFFTDATPFRIVHRLTG